MGDENESARGRVARNSVVRQVVKEVRGMINQPIC
jgi:hypothetical protein